jgi:hypothetical protein
VKTGNASAQDLRSSEKTAGRIFSLIVSVPSCIFTKHVIRKSEEDWCEEREILPHFFVSSAVTPGVACRVRAIRLDDK